MEKFNHPVRKLLPMFERHEPIARDHTATIAFKKCPRYYFLRIVLGFTTTKTPQYFVFGSAYHKFREIFDKTNDQEVAWKATMKVWEKGGGNKPVAPNDKWAFLSLDRLLMSVLASVKKTELDKAHGRVEILAVEQDFAIQLVNPEDESEKMIISGKADRIDKINGRAWGRDHKTSSKQKHFYPRQLNPNDQVTRYTFAENVLNGWDYKNPMAIPPVSGQIYEVLFNSKTTKPEIVQFTETRTPSQLQSWLRNQFQVERMITSCRERDEWPMAESQCNFCDFHDVCSRPNENSMVSELTSSFKIEPWDSQNRDTDES